MVGRMSNKLKKFDIFQKNFHDIMEEYKGESNIYTGDTIRVIFTQAVSRTLKEINDIRNEIDTVNTKVEDNEYDEIQGVIQSINTNQDRMQRIEATVIFDYWPKNKDLSYEVIARVPKDKLNGT